MHTQITQLLAGLSCAVGFLLFTVSIQDQARSTLRRTSAPQERNVRAEDSTEKQKKVQLPPQSPWARPVVLPQSNNRSPSEIKSAKTQTETAAAAPLSGECGVTLLAVDEMSVWHFEYWNVPCLGCRISTFLTQSSPGILGFSKNPAGPWTETLTVFTDLDFSGHGVSEAHYIKGLSVGTSTLHTQDGWTAPINIDFEVVTCTCPSIPIVP